MKVLFMLTIVLLLCGGCIGVYEEPVIYDPPVIWIPPPLIIVRPFPHHYPHRYYHHYPRR